MIKFRALKFIFESVYIVAFCNVILLLYLFIIIFKNY